ncbi:PAS-domain containing protein [Defluviimonas sp. WL0024]|uniref:PAS-domain containing protein n=1 Tax=Albidovulum salinarum TaxID=2984153 RepID=A0ABT2X280_9RHOB|nr:PAS-domain containing protein [Defluviimonas sp. WL0024]MCU9848057.1 PAS-domain containing protein [Defluviimonas sp. WL0024]
MIELFAQAAILFATSLGSAVAALLLLSFLPQRRNPASSLSGNIRALEQAVFLFADDELIDSTRSARDLLKAIPGSGTEWQRLHTFLSQRVDGIDDAFASLPDRGEVELESRGEAEIRVSAEWLDGVTRVTITDLSAEGQNVVVDALSHRAERQELEALRETLAAAPMPVWRTTAEGAVNWANPAYLDRITEQRGVEKGGLTWPLPPLFAAATAETHEPRRHKLSTGTGKSMRWYECHSVPAATGTLNFALPADREVRAESSLREFLQTLTKTFAHLPIGLAVFDRKRQLALFNPALVDLTSLGVDFLSARPSLVSFLDRLREARVIPEPKDYHGWRQQMSELEKAAESGLYEDTWTLPSGQTYRVTGRPHPDGAVAFQIEDISSEIALTRHFRSEVALGQSVVDTLREAIAVFSTAGELILSNAAYDRLWGVETGSTLGTPTIADSRRIWQGRSEPTPVWGEIRDFVGAIGERTVWSAEISLAGGALLGCRCVPLAGGATLVGFVRREDDGAGGRPREGGRASVAALDLATL